METKIRKIDELLSKGDAPPPKGWHLRVIQSEDCQSYVAWNDVAREALVVDPKREDWDTYLSLSRDLPGYLWLAVIDTHTHADHVSCASTLASALKAPLVMHQSAPSAQVQLRSGPRSLLPSKAAPVDLIHSPGHTLDSLVAIWGPFLFGGDTILFGDVGRDDLPTGDPEAHFESLQKIKTLAHGDMIVLPGHDHKGGRISSWVTQLQLNTSLTQGREDFVREAAAFDAPAPRLLKESLKHNFR